MRESCRAFSHGSSTRARFKGSLGAGAEGSNQLSIRRPVLESLTVRMPSFANQHRIVALAQLAQQERRTLQQLM